MTPYQRGQQDAEAGRNGPEFPKGDASWAERLYHRGWCDGRARLALTNAGKSEIGGEA